MPRGDRSTESEIYRTLRTKRNEGPCAICSLLPCCALAFFPTAYGESTAQGKTGLLVFNVRDLGARNDGSAAATNAISAAIQAAKKVGGGTVFIPAGNYVSGPIEMVSNLTLNIDAGAIIRFPATKPPLVPSRQQSVEVPTPMLLIGGHDLENVTVVGHGVLMSSNADWPKLHPHTGREASEAGSANGPKWEKLLLDLNAHKPIPQAEFDVAGAELRPSFVRFMNSKNILVDGLHFIGSPMWTVHLLYSENAVVENLVIETYPGVHTDGIVIDSSRFVKLMNDYIDMGDDGTVIKSGKNADGLRVNRPTEDVTITNRTVHHAHGAVTIGNETSGGVRKLVASNITVVGNSHARANRRQAKSQDPVPQSADARHPELPSRVGNRASSSVNLFEVEVSQIHVAVGQNVYGKNVLSLAKGNFEKL